MEYREHQRGFVLTDAFGWRVNVDSVFFVVTVESLTAGESDTPQSRLCGDPVGARVPNHGWGAGC